MRLPRVSFLALAGLALTAASSSCFDDDPPSIATGYTGLESAVLVTAEARVILSLRRFRMQVTTPTGAVLLDTLTTDPSVPGDEAHAYGAIGATHEALAPRASILEGFDHVVRTDDPWIHGWDVKAAQTTA